MLDPLADVTCSPAEYAEIASARYAALTGAHGFRPEFETVLRDAEERTDDPQTRSYLRAQRTSLLAIAGKLDEAVAMASTVDAEVDEITALRVVPGLGGALACRGKWDAAIAVSDGMLESALRHRDDIPHAPFWVMSNQLMTLIGSGRLDDADALIELVGTTVGTGAARADVASFLAVGRGAVALRRGQVRTATRWLRETAGGMRDISDFRLPIVLASLTEASALTGDRDAATAASAEADKLINHAPIFEGLVRRARAWARSRAGNARLPPGSRSTLPPGAARMVTTTPSCSP